MDKLIRYRQIIKQVLEERADLMRRQPMPGEEIVCILDETTDNYLLIRLWCDKDKRAYSVRVHVRLINGKVYVEQDWTDDFLPDLLYEGVRYEDIMPPLETPSMYQQSNLTAIG